ncbi:hypothetical protein J7I98_16730 [Streptomyces sp. ISL-98]|uniref:hypothetical protein n=1 Tax=Streptomyces sp. ISL-98 TaxID=2819192 RepID=UPI001BEBBB46|nr:hypothetical protein [Streptomyces sp. ISL-98]MBT2507500.1 hypothetical protein [Streptomyces sp. ISL-98]
MDALGLITASTKTPPMDPVNNDPCSSSVTKAPYKCHEDARESSIRPLGLTHDDIQDSYAPTLERLFCPGSGNSPLWDHPLTLDGIADYTAESAALTGFESTPELSLLICHSPRHIVSERGPATWAAKRSADCAREALGEHRTERDRSFDVCLKVPAKI